MSVTAVVGANWGDEGKGRITDFLAAGSDYVVRFQGGANAGHTVINHFGKFALHMLPSGVFCPHVVNVLGPGVALNVRNFVAELAVLASRGVPPPRVVVSERAQVVAPYHPLLDACEEERLGDAQFRSTKAGIAPFYSDKYAKTGIQVADLLDPVRLENRIEGGLPVQNTLLEHLYGRRPLVLEDLLRELSEQAEFIKPYVCDTTALLQDALRLGKRVLLEGQLGALRDPDHGIYPFSTSSSPLAGFATVGAGIPPHAITRVIAVVKAYSTCVGAGPFVSELSGRDAETLRARGGDAGEYGATTGRPRRVGWFDAVASRYGCEVQGATEVALTAIDVLGYLDQIPVCVAYSIDGQVVRSFPTTAKLERAAPVLETFKGWRCDISEAREWSDLPAAARDYVLRLEGLVGVRIRWVSVGPARQSLIER
jgi:adenylosuccinate synthase